MCGLAGIYAYGAFAAPVDFHELKRICDSMKLRGPDGEGQWEHSTGQVAFAHRRLSIIDLLDRASQPMKSSDGNHVITFNGEIYNFKALRRELEQKGRVFKTDSDTEVLLQLYQDQGADMVHALRGMFAFAIWDDDKRQLFLARDPYGIKPLYYSNDGATFRFASQVKALLSGGAIVQEADSAGWTGFFMFGSVPEPFTTYRNIRSLPAGARMFVTQNGAGSVDHYHSIASAYRNANDARTTHLDQDEVVGIAREALLDSVRHHLVSDVPVGAFLSGGIDSGALVGLMRDAGQSKIKTVTLAFEEYQGGFDDETPIASKVAELYETDHTVRMVSKNEFMDDLPKMLTAMDQPTIDGINTWFVSKAAHELGLKVAVSGLGGDELFGGYPSFRDIPRSVRLFKPFSHLPTASRGLRKLFNALELGRRGLNPKVAGLAELGGTYAGAYLLRRGLFMPWELDKVLDPDIWREGLKTLSPIERMEEVLEDTPKSGFAKVATMESSLYMRNQLLRDTDWTSMSHSLEVRVPLVDSHLLSKMAPITSREPWQQNKYLLSKSPNTPLPASVSQKAKTGFTTPIGKWMKSLPANSDTARNTKNQSAQHWSRSWASYIHGEMAQSTT